MRRRDFLFLAAASAAPRAGGELRMCLRSEPKTLDPLLAADRSSEIVRYLTGGPLLRIHRASQGIEAAAAQSWRVLNGGRRIRFQLRPGLRFSDGQALRVEDVLATFRRLADPSLHSPTADSFRTGPEPPKATADGPGLVTIHFPAPVGGVERLFDQVSIQPAEPARRNASLGPFVVEEHKPGVHLRLRRNPHYFLRGAGGAALPYLDSVLLEIQQNREMEMFRFRRGELHLMISLDPELFERLAAASPECAQDGGPSLEAEVLWFNQAAGAPIPAHRKEWFRSTGFRRAVSAAINRDDLVRVVYRNRAVPAAGPVSPANRLWFNASVRAQPHDPRAALQRLEGAGFRLKDGQLRDRGNQAVEFSLITNAGNKARERMAAMIQQDLLQIGIRVNLVPLDFPSLLERITRSLHYESCLLGLVNVDPDPNSQMSVWLSSGSNHQWNPNQKSPETGWEAEIDRWMRQQASSVDPAVRKAAFDRVQQIVFDQAPFLYLLHPNALCGVSASLRNVSSAVLLPQALWNVEQFWFEPPGSGRRS